jgi:hypothetical protein
MTPASSQTLGFPASSFFPNVRKWFPLPGTLSWYFTTAHTCPGRLCGLSPVKLPESRFPKWLCPMAKLRLDPQAYTIIRLSKSKFDPNFYLYLILLTFKASCDQKKIDHYICISKMFSLLEWCKNSIINFC